ncbi:hypothetical protein [Lacticaseibacillus paracasei]|jgi:hypothetical protein|uniref:hypothetical protein n=1 Tax=Lacticaseibacillus paracasei TaxID=1597 RepID=UPI001066ECEA|nr:hypothetical protein [Lacticaseibacillus paracasei]MBB1167068.1 hypothetical protein [Lacticaseibacillus paracasei]
MIAFERTKSVAGGSKRYGSTMLLNGSSFIELSRHEPSKQQPSLKISRHGAVQAFRGGLFMSIYLLQPPTSLETSSSSKSTEASFVYPFNKLITCIFFNAAVE